MTRSDFLLSASCLIAAGALAAHVPMHGPAWGVFLGAGAVSLAFSGFGLLRETLRLGELRRRLQETEAGGAHGTGPRPIEMAVFHGGDPP